MHFFASIPMTDRVPYIDAHSNAFLIQALASASKEFAVTLNLFVRPEAGRGVHITDRVGEK